MPARYFGDFSTNQISQQAADVIAVQPIGATEQHGPHLPVITDALIAEHITKAACDISAAASLILPTLAYGRSGEHHAFAGTISLSTATLIALCMDLGKSLANSGITKLIFINGHGGQPHTLETVARDIRAEYGLNVFIITPMRAGVPSGVGLLDQDYGIHAGEEETSVMLALAPELVNMDAAAADGHTAHSDFAAFHYLTRDGATPTAWLTEDFSSNGVIGDPRGATASKGQAIVDHWINFTAATIDEVDTFRFTER